MQTSNFCCGICWCDFNSMLYYIQYTVCAGDFASGAWRWLLHAEMSSGLCLRYYIPFSVLIKTADRHEKGIVQFYFFFLWKKSLKGLNNVNKKGILQYRYFYILNKLVKINNALGFVFTELWNEIIIIFFCFILSIHYYFWNNSSI